MFQLSGNDQLAAHFDLDRRRRPDSLAAGDRSADDSIWARSIAREVEHRTIARVSYHGMIRVKTVLALQPAEVRHILEFAGPEWLPQRECPINAIGKMDDDRRKIIGSLWHMKFESLGRPALRELRRRGYWPGPYCQNYSRLRRRYRRKVHNRYGRGYFL